MSVGSRHAPVIVVGGGNAGLIAAISAREAGSEVILLERSERDERGGNSRYASGIFRFAHSGVDDLRALAVDDVDWRSVRASPYPADLYLSDIVGDAGPEIVDRRLVEVFARDSLETVRWLIEHGVSFRLNTVSGSSPNVIQVPNGGELIVVGNGRALVEALYGRAEAIGVDICYGSRVVDVVMIDDAVRGVELAGGKRLDAAAVVLTSASFEASAERRERHLGPAWGAARVRGTRFNDGALLERMVGRGVRPKGDWSLAHAVPVDVSAPEVGDLEIGDSTARYSFPFGISVNRDGERFVDEGEKLAPFAYSELGRRILKEPGSVAFQVFDATTTSLLEPRYATGSPIVADTIEELEKGMALPEGSLVRTVADYNAACTGEAGDPTQLDGLAASPAGQPRKSNWATPIARPPFSAYPVTCGITFSNGGLEVDEGARAIGANGAAVVGLYAAGEIIGGFFRAQVPSGAGLMRGSVFARRAGRGAAGEAGAANG